MEYDYEKEKSKIFLEENQEMFLKIRDNISSLIASSGACKLGNAISGCTGDTFTMIACVDRILEIDNYREIDYGKCSGQDRIFVEKYRT